MKRCIALLPMLVAACLEPRGEPPTPRTQSAGQGATILHGKSEDSYGRRAWILRLDPERGSGALYDPPGVTSLCHAAPAGEEWRSGRGHGGFRYVFEALAADAPRGVIEVLDHRSGAPRRRFEVDWVRLAPVDANESYGFTGVFSDRRYLEDPGDILGTELVLLEGSSGIRGGISFSEGEPSRPYDVIVRGRAPRLLEFEVDQGRTTRRRFRAELVEGGMHLMEEGGESIILDERTLIDALFEREPDCS